MSQANDIAAAILAAGEGTRTGSDLPKALLTLGGQSLIERVVGSAAVAGVSRIVVVIGHGRELVQQALGNHVSYAVQQHQRGTAHALCCAREALRGFAGYLLALYCDIPLVPPQMLKELVHRCAAPGTAAAMVTVELESPGAYGRVIRSPQGEVIGIKEAAGATPEELAIKEINAGIYCFKAPLIFDVAAEVEPDPVKGEYYLTDAIAILAARGYRIAVVKAEDPALVMGINTPQELEEAERTLRHARR